jgi:hypothetical protein
MSRQNINADCERETAEARAEMLRRAEAQGVRPLSFDEMLGDPEPGQTPEEIRQEVDDFLTLPREVRGDAAVRFTPEEKNL